MTTHPPNLLGDDDEDLEISLISAVNRAICNAISVQVPFGETHIAAQEAIRVVLSMYPPTPPDAVLESLKPWLLPDLPEWVHTIKAAQLMNNNWEAAIEEWDAEVIDGVINHKRIRLVEANDYPTPAAAIRAALADALGKDGGDGS